MKGLGVILLLVVVAFFAHAKVKEKPNSMECSIAYEHFGGDILVILLSEQIAAEEYKAINKNEALSSLTINIIKIKETNKFQSKNALFKLSNFSACESDFRILRMRLDNKIKMSELKSSK